MSPRHAPTLPVRTFAPPRGTVASRGADSVGTIVSFSDPWRRSRLDASAHRLAVADLHNHSVLSDGHGDPETAFAQMRAAGLDVAALTDHSSIPRSVLATLNPDDYPDDEALALARFAPHSIDQQAWQRTGALADAHDVPGEFTALRGFEWTEPWLGHVNVWFSDTFVPVTTPGSLAGLFEFLDDAAPDALFGYNHPGREPGALDDFSLPPSHFRHLQRRMVALEAFNRREDFLFQPRLGGPFSPLVDCLEAGWRPALIGCSDEHGRQYALEGKGRTGLWVSALTRDGVREALAHRRAFATREIGLRLDARLDGVPAGQVAPGLGGRDTVDPARGTDIPAVTSGRAVELLLEVDLAAPELDGTEVELQVLTGRAGEVVPVHTAGATCGEVSTHAVVLPPGLPWVVVRVADPAREYGNAYGGPPTEDHACANWALAYTSPWYAVPTS